MDRVFVRGPEREPGAALRTGRRVMILIKFFWSRRSTFCRAMDVAEEYFFSQVVMLGGKFFKTVMEVMA